MVIRRSCRRLAATLIITLPPLLATCLGFSPLTLIVASRQQQHRHQSNSNIGSSRRANQLFQHPALASSGTQSIAAGRRRLLWMGESSSSSESLKTNSSSNSGILKTILFRCNASTKWVVTLINTLALWTRPHRYEGPFIVFGSIVAVYFTNFLKNVINQSRPDGAPFADPGMPSSHGLTCFFVASAWNYSPIVASHRIQVLAWFGAAVVAWLRVACGYHSWAQVGVGAGLGSLLGSIWAACGQYWYQQFPAATFYTSWALYLSGAALFISTKMKDWVTHEKDL